MDDLITKIEEAPLDFYIAEAKSFTLDEFIKNHNNADFLVSHGPIKRDDPMQTQRMAFATQAGSLGDWARGEHTDGSVVYEIPWEKIDWDAQYHRRLWVGRAPNCAIQVVHKSVSKLHGSFKKDRDEIIYSDADSTNKTRINSKTLKPYEDTVIKKGDVLSFGGVKFNIYSAKAFYNMLRKIE